MLDFPDRTETIIGLEPMPDGRRMGTLKHDTTDNVTKVPLGCIGLHRVCGGAKLKDLTRIRPNRAGVREWTPEVRV